MSVTFYHALINLYVNEKARTNTPNINDINVSRDIFIFRFKSEVSTPPKLRAVYAINETIIRIMAIKFNNKQIVLFISMGFLQERQYLTLKLFSA